MVVLRGSRKMILRKSDHSADTFLFDWLCSNNSNMVCSVTRFGEISPLWQNLRCLWQIFEGLFDFWHSLKPTLAIFYAIGQFCIDVKFQILKNNLDIWSH